MNMESAPKGVLRRIALARTEEVAEGEVIRVEAEGEAFAIYHLPDGDFRVTTDVCTHGVASLSEGWIVDDCQIECPLHGGCFDIRTGAAVSPPCEVDIAVYPVTIEGGVVCIDL